MQGMDLTAEIESMAPSGERSEDFAVSVGEKRPAENGEDCELEGPTAKKARACGGLVGNMKKVAEIVLVLAAMGKMRGGRSPTAAEKEMMAEARGKLAEACEEFAPKDVFPRDAFGAVIDDLGLNKLREQRLGFRPPKMSIADKLLLTKRKMEELQEFSLHSATYSSQRLQTNLGAAAEGRGMSHAVRMLPSDKPSHSPISAGGFQPTSPLGHVSAANSTSLPYQLPTSEVRPVVSSGLPSSHLGKDSSSLALPRVERPHFRLDGRSNGSSHTSQVQANSSGDHTQVRTPTWSLQFQSALSAKTGSDNKVPAHPSIKVEGTADISWVAPQATSKPSITQTTSGNPLSINQNFQGVNFVQAPLCNVHNEIGKIVQKLLQPQLPEHPTWTPPSRDYMNKALTCQMCKLTINEVDSALVCDACEKGYHLKCLQSHNLKGIPRGEWHCGKCLTISNGKPLPPKYGRVMRNIGVPKVNSNAAAGQSSSEKKVGTVDEKINQLTANGVSGLQSAPTGLADNYNHSATSLKIANAREVQGNDMLSSGGKMDEMTPSGTCRNKLIKPSEAHSVPFAAGLSVERSSEKTVAAETKSQLPAETETVVNPFDQSQAFGKPQDNDQVGLPNNVEVPSKQCHDNNAMVKDLKKSCSGETLKCNQNNEIKQAEQGVARVNPFETSGSIAGTRERANSSSDGLHSVDWIGDILQIVDEKTYYQSCCINGVVYKVQDHALFHLNNNHLTPSKLQAMWEDSKTRSKWVLVNTCFFPADLPEKVGRPCAPESNEVYESNHDSTVMAGLIRAPCEVLPPSKFVEESGTRKRPGIGPNNQLRPPLFICKWFYDESKGVFRDVSS